MVEGSLDQKSCSNPISNQSRMYPRSVSYRGSGKLSGPNFPKLYPIPYFENPIEYPTCPLQGDILVRGPCWVVFTTSRPACPGLGCSRIPSVAGSRVGPGTGYTRVPNTAEASVCLRRLYTRVPEYNPDRVHLGPGWACISGILRAWLYPGT